MTSPLTALCRDCLWLGQPAPRRCPRCASPRLVAHGELDRLTIAHLDCDAFYASVEKRDRPELRDLPVIVGGGRRGVVTTACYIARISGVRSAMPMFTALKLCPEAVVIRPDFAKYKEASRQIMDLLRALTPLVQPLSLDEAWVDLAGTERLNGGCAAFQLARVQGRIEAEVGLTISIGLSVNKFLAKIASDLDKPRGYSVIGGGEARAFLAPRPVGILPGVGPAMVKALAAANLRTVGDIARADLRDMGQRFGAYGLRLHQLSRGEDSRPVNPNEARKGVSNETTFETDISDCETLEDILWPLCEKTARRCREAGVAGRAVVLKLKTADFRIITRRRTLPVPVQTAKGLFATARELLAPEARGVAYRLIGIGAADLIESADVELDLFGQSEARALKSEQAVDALRARFGSGAVLSGRSLKPRT